MIKVNGIQWTSSSQHVDVETGEQINKKRLHEYIKLRTIKKTKLNERKTKGHIEYTIELRRNPQQKLSFD